MKTGILNLQSSSNYGAVLVAASLERFIRENTAHEVVHFDYKPEQKPVRLSLPQRAVRKAIGTVRQMVCGARCQEGASASIQGADVFEKFRSEWIARTGTAATLDELRARAADCDAGIVGSDQVWRLLYTRHTFPAFFLPFLPDGALRIAYAASFGTDQWEGDSAETDIAAGLLRRFDAVSVREDSGKRICRETFGVQAEQVLDPTLLVGRDFFDEIIEKASAHAEPVDVVYYKLHTGVCGFRDLEQITMQTGLSLKNILYAAKKSDSGEVQDFYHPVPEWLASIRDAGKMVVADSFHAICFSILFEKNFIWIPNKSGGNARIESLLEEFGLLSRRCSRISEIKQRLLVDEPIDYCDVNRKLAVMRKSSGRFLLDALQREPRELQ